MPEIIKVPQIHPQTGEPVVGVWARRTPQPPHNVIPGDLSRTDTPQPSHNYANYTGVTPQSASLDPNILKAIKDALNNRRPTNVFVKIGASAVAFAIGFGALFVGVGELRTYARDRKLASITELMEYTPLGGWIPGEEPSQTESGAQNSENPSNEGQG